ncbi:MAG: hypothetical protein J6W29_08325, partial [Neisseriaceae bacterium]|nr:hypothetical protein [Neisseriaceae bacterium]
GNLKLAVYNEDGDYFVSLSRFDKNIPIAEIDEKMIEPTRQERIYFFQNTDDLEKLSQYLREIEQGISASEVPENGVEMQSETVSGSLKEQQKTIFRQWAEEKGYQPLEFSHSFLSFVYGNEIAARVRPRPTAIIQDKGGSTCIVEFSRMGDPRPFERFALPMNVDEVRQALDNSEVGKMLAQRPKFSKMLNEITPEMKAVLEQTYQSMEKYLKEQEEQGIRAIESSENGVGTITTQYAQSFVGKKWNSQTIQDAVILPDGAIQLQIGGAWYHENALSYSKFERINDIARQTEYSDLDILKLKAFARSYKDNAGDIHSDFGKAESAYDIAHTTRKKIGMRGFDENGLSVYNRVTAALAMAGVNSPVYDINFDTNKIKFDPKTIANSFLGKLKEQEQGISVFATPENSQERQPENTVQGTTTPENSDRLPENSKLHFHFDEQLFEKIETAKKRGDENFRFEDETNLQNLAYIIDENGVGAGVDFEKFISTPYSITDPLSWKERIVCHLVNTDKDTGNLISHYGTYYTIEEDNEDDFYADFSKDNPQLKQQVFKVLTNFL